MKYTLTAFFIVTTVIRGQQAISQKPKAIIPTPQTQEPTQSTSVKLTPRFQLYYMADIKTAVGSNHPLGGETVFVPVKENLIFRLDTETGQTWLYFERLSDGRRQIQWVKVGE